jgi:hypothetical protein
MPKAIIAKYADNAKGSNDFQELIIVDLHGMKELTVKH